MLSPRPLRGVDEANEATDVQNTPCYSVPFGQYIRQDIKLNEAMKQLTCRCIPHEKTNGSIDDFWVVPEEVLKLKETRGFVVETEGLFVLLP